MSVPTPIPRSADDEPAGDPGQPDSGALIRWEKADGGPSGSIGLLGIRTVILCLVLCTDRSITDGELGHLYSPGSASSQDVDTLHAHLKRLGLFSDTVLPYTSADNKDLPLTLDKYLDLLAKQNYLEKVSVGSAICTEALQRTSSR
jgi:hypothetical protein